MGGRFSSSPAAAPQVMGPPPPRLPPPLLHPPGTSREHLAGAAAAASGGMYRLEPRASAVGLSPSSSSSTSGLGRGSRNGATQGLFVANSHSGHAIGGLSLPAAAEGNSSGTSRSPNSRESTPASEDPSHGRSLATSLPLHLFSFRDIKCPICGRILPPDDFECHLVMCLTRPRISYNEEVLTEDKDECIICLDEMVCGETIARLPCLCIYHKTCIDKWFEVNRSCPEHPGD